MRYELNADEIKKHNQLSAQAHDLTRGEILLDGQPLSARPSFFARRRLNKAIRLFDEVLRMNPENWSAMWGKAKALHRLGDKVRAFDLTLKAHQGNPGFSAFAREAGLLALQIGRIREGIELMEAAISTQPGDAGLYSNLGLGYLFG